MLLIALSLSLAGCGSGGSSGHVTTPGNTQDIEFLYCRVVAVEGEMHAQWATDCPTTADIRFGRASYTDLMNVTSRADTHDVVLPGLTYNARYIYRVTVRDSLSHSAESEGNFTTPDKATPEPVILGLQILAVSETSAQVTWRTDEPATTILHYGIAAATDSVLDAALVMNHTVQLANLLPATLYHLRAEAVDSTGLRGYGRDTLVTTASRMILSFPDTTVAVGDTISLPLRITNALDLAALRFGISLIPGSVELISVDAGPFYSDHDGFIFFQDIRPSEGTLYTDLTWSIQYNGNLRTGTHADGNGIVAYARLKGLTAGGTGASFVSDSSFALDVLATQRPCSLRAGTLTVVP